MSARRADYFHLALIGAESPALTEVYRSLRFSTHCQLSVASNREPDPAAPWVAWTTLDDAHATAGTADLVLNVSDGECTAAPVSSLAEQLPNVAVAVDQALRDAGAFLDAALRSAPQAVGVAGSPDFVRLDFFRTFSGETQYIGGCCSADGKLWVPLANHAASTLAARLEAALSGVRCRGSFSCRIRRVRDGDYSIDGLDRACGHWSAYRAVGVNIPLLYIQDHLQRRFDVFHFVDLHHLEVVDTAALRYCFDVKHIFVDLDETLIIDARRVDYVTAFLRHCAAGGARVSIVSRHEHDIVATLERAGIELALFEGIHAVRDGGRKSACVPGVDGAVFIDNEFAERLDVRQRSGIPVLDTNQLDFFGVTSDLPGN